MRETIKNWELRFSTTQIIALGFLIVIIVGAVLLSLPIARADGKPENFIDALFMATTSVCVTGLVLEPTYLAWSVFGKTVILILIQLGGLGFMTCFTILLLMMGKRITMKERMVIQDSLNENKLTGLVRLVRKIVKGTLVVEGVGAVFLSFQFIPQFGIGKGLAVSVFTSVSAFCNAGIDIIAMDSLVAYHGNVLVNVVVMFLIISGGIGYTVWWDIITQIKRAVREKRVSKKIFAKLTLHSKVVLFMTVFLLISGACVFFIMEYHNPLTMKDFSLKDKILASFFQATTIRTAGFMTIDQNAMTVPSQFLSVIYMFIGGSPAGTAGGVKTSTVGIVILLVVSVVRGKENVEAFRRTVPYETVQKAVTIITISLCAVIASTMILSITENASFMVILYEVTSALATVGLSMGLTPELTEIGKIIIIVLMYLGRIGPITMILAFTMKKRKMKNNIKMPEEKIMVG